MITLHFSTANDFNSRMIRTGQLGFWASHVETIAANGSYFSAYSSGVKYQPEAQNAGVIEYQTTVTVPCTLEQETAYWNFMNSQIGAPYDTSAAYIMAEDAGLAKQTADNNNGWQCASIHMAALVISGIVKACPVEIKLTTPRDVFVAVGALTTIGLVTT